MHIFTEQREPVYKKPRNRKQSRGAMPSRCERSVRAKRAAVLFTQHQLALNEMKVNFCVAVNPLM